MKEFNVYNTYIIKFKEITLIIIISTDTVVVSYKYGGKLKKTALLKT
jgi:hypothetical protein